MTPEKIEKCAHPGCTCEAPSGKYCSIECETVAKTPDIDCRCGHSGCNGNTH
jgi:hypothetical protein